MKHKIYTTPGEIKIPGLSSNDFQESEWDYDHALCDFGHSCLSYQAFIQYQ
jgi:hypothetical protein